MRLTGIIPGRRELAVMSAAVLAVSLMTSTPGYAAETRTSAQETCRTFLPATTPTVIRTQQETWSYAIGRSIEASLSVTLRVTEPLSLEIPGTIEEGRVSFQLPPDRLPQHKKILYAVEVSIDEIQCTTSPAPLSFMLSNLSPAEALDLPWSVRQDFVHSAAHAFIYAAGRAGLLTDSTDQADIATLCGRLFSAPTPCDWAPGEARTRTGEDASPPSPALEVGRRKTTTAPSAASALCKTIRLRNAPEDAGYWYWGDFVVERPGLLTPFTTSRGHADKTNQDHNRINLLSDVSRNATGVASTNTYGNVGFHLRFGSSSTASIAIVPTLSYSTHGRHTGLAWRPIPPWPGTSSAQARLRIASYAKNVTKAQTMTGGTVYDKITPVSDGIGFDTADESYQVNSSVISLPTLTDVSNGDVLRFYVRGNATASAEALGPTGAGATSNVSEDPTDFNDSTPERRFVQANYVDLQLTDPNYYWVDTSRCVAYW